MTKKHALLENDFARLRRARAAAAGVAACRPAIPIHCNLEPSE